MKTLREYINLIEAAQADFKPVKSQMWATNTLAGNNDDLKGSLKTVRYDQNAAGDHRFTTLSQGDDDEGTLQQRTLPASSNLRWVANEEEELEETSEEAIKKIEDLNK